MGCDEGPTLYSEGVRAIEWPTIDSQMAGNVAVEVRMMGLRLSVLIKLTYVPSDWDVRRNSNWLPQILYVRKVNSFSIKMLPGQERALSPGWNVRSKIFLN